MPRNPETSIYRGDPSEVFARDFIRRAPELDHYEEVAFERMVAPYFHDKPQHTQLGRDFPPGAYKRGELESDYQEVLRLRDRDKKDDTERGRILEAFFGQQAARLGWFGENCRAVRTTEYDDRKNATDLVLVFNTGEGEPLYLAIDVTTAENPATLNKKLNRLVEGIDTGNLTDLKYFCDETGKGDKQPALKQLRGLPRVVIGLTPEGVAALSKDLAPYLASGGKNTAAERALRSHDIQSQLLKDVKQQLENEILRSVLRYIQLISEKDEATLFNYRCEQLGPDNYNNVRALLNLVHDGVLLEKTDEKLVGEFDKLLEGVPLLEELGKKFGITYPLTEIVEKHSQIRNQLSLVLEKKEGSRVSPETRAQVRTLGLSRPAWLRTDRLGAEPFRKWLNRLPPGQPQAA
ncbi:MAG: hypothetical protein PHH01_04230 [Patescibacteria group bacterium]|nr:hypothetical protein [Patescibacteria group bacterium]